MAGVNKVILLGRLGADPEVRSLPNGAKVANFGLATSEAYNNKDGVRVEQTEWHRVELWDNLANIAEQYLHKGDSAYVEGKIRTEEYTDKEGVVRKAVKIRGTSLTLVGDSKGSQQGSNSTPQVQAPRPTPPREPVAPTPGFETNAGGESNDDLPF